MPSPQKTRDLARSLVACEADTSASILQFEPATVRVYERLRRQLSATVDAMELGFHVTLICDATAAFTKETMHAAHELNGPTFAHQILTTAALIEALPKSVPAAYLSRSNPIPQSKGHTP